MIERQGKSRRIVARACMRASLAVWLSLLLVCTAFPGVARAQAVPMESAPVSVLTVPVSQSFLLRYPNAKRVSAGDGDLLDVKVFEDTQDILLIGRRAGITRSEEHTSELQSRENSD